MAKKISKKRGGQPPINYKKGQKPAKTAVAAANPHAISYDMTIELLSPLHLGSGQGDVNLDTDVCHDEYGLPYFPAKRLKGLLYESALEVAEMAALSDGFLEAKTVGELFGHTADSQVQITVHDFFLPDYAAIQEYWRNMAQRWPHIFRAETVLATYSALRFHTSIDPATGLAADSSLHNMRVVNEGLMFQGQIMLENSAPAHQKALLLAVANLRRAGLKRNRGLGQIKCRLTNAAFTLAEAMNWGVAPTPTRGTAP